MLRTAPNDKEINLVKVYSEHNTMNICEKNVEKFERTYTLAIL